VNVIKRHEEVTSAALFSGGTAPRFYYNVEPKEPANYLAQVLINTRHADDVVPYRFVRDGRERSRRQIADIAVAFELRPGISFMVLVDDGDFAMQRLRIERCIRRDDREYVCFANAANRSISA